MPTTYLTDFIAAMRYLIRDSTATYDFSDTEVQNIITHVIKEVSMRSPYRVNETALLTANSKKLDISGISNLLNIDKVEYKPGQNPEQYRNYRYNDNETIIMDVSSAPSETGTSGTLTGTLTFTAGSATVTGAGTAFLTELAQDYFICRSDGTRWYRVQSVESDTSLTLDETVKTADDGIDGPISYALDFDGVDDYVNIPHNANQLLTGGGTIEAWIKPDTAGESTGRIIDKSTNGYGGGGFDFSVISNNRIAFRINEGPALSSTTNSVVVGGGNWYHIVATWDSSGYVTLYVNGVQSGTPGVSADPAGITTTNDMRIGNRSGATDRTFDGVIDEVRIYNRELSASEISYNYHSGLGYYTPYDSDGLICHFHFDGNDGTTATDSSDTENDGTISGASWTSGKSLVLDDMTKYRYNVAVIHCEKLHTLTDATKTLNPNEERVLTEGVTAYLLAQWVNKLRSQVNEAVTIITSLHSSTGDITSRLNKAVSYLNQGEGLIDENRDTAKGILDEIPDLITKAQADLLLARDYINTVPIGSSPESDYFNSAGRNLNVASQKLGLVNGYLNVDNVSSQYAGYARTEIGNISALVSQVNGYAREIQSRLNIASIIANAQGKADRQMAIYKQALNEITPLKTYSTYSPS